MANTLDGIDENNKPRLSSNRGIVGAQWTLDTTGQDGPPLNVDGIGASGFTPRPTTPGATFTITLWDADKDGNTFAVVGTLTETDTVPSTVPAPLLDHVVPTLDALSAGSVVLHYRGK